MDEEWTPSTATKADADADADTKATPFGAQASPSRTRRRYALVVAGVMASALLAGSCGDDVSTDLAGRQPSPGIESLRDATRSLEDPTRDVVRLELGQPDASDYQAALIELKNNGPRRFNYTVEVALRSPDESRQYETMTFAVNGLEPGQSVIKENPTFVKHGSYPDDAVLRVNEIVRTGP
jgi:hypothetical protein